MQCVNPLREPPNIMLMHNMSFLHSTIALVLSFTMSFAAAQTSSKARTGVSSFGKVILTVTGPKVHIGDSAYGDVVFTIDPPSLRGVDSSFGAVIATLGSEGRIHIGGSPYGKVIATVVGSKVYEGNSASGRVIATIDIAVECQALPQPLFCC